MDCGPGLFHATLTAGHHPKAARAKFAGKVRYGRGTVQTHTRRSKGK